VFNEWINITVDAIPGSDGVHNLTRHVDAHAVVRGKYNYEMTCKRHNIDVSAVCCPLQRC
jgi:hypothetical protein